MSPKAIIYKLNELKKRRISESQSEAIDKAIKAVKAGQKLKALRK